MDINFLKASIENCEYLSKLKKEIWATTYQGIYSDDALNNYDYNEHRKKFIDMLDGLYLIMKDNLIIGYFHFGISKKYSYKDYKYSINALYILSEYQNKGIGRKVFEFINEYCKENKISQYYNCVNKYNISAYNFYLKMGGRVDFLEDSDDDKSKHQYYIVYRV